MKNSSIIFPKKTWQFSDKEKESVENDHHLYSVGTWHLKIKKSNVFMFKEILDDDGRNNWNIKYFIFDIVIDFWD